MASEKKNSKQKSVAKKCNPGTSSENVKLKSLPKRKASDKLSEKTKRTATDTGNKIRLHIRPMLKTSNNSFDSNILHFLYNSSLKEQSALITRKFQKSCIRNYLSKDRVFTTLSPFHRRVTSIAWHPKYSQIIVAASKGGELSLYNLNKNGSIYSPGIGPGGSVVGLKFNLDDPSLVYTSSITGHIRQEDFNAKKGKNIFSISCLENWFSSLDISYDKKMLMSGDTVGNVYLLTEDGKKVWTKIKRLHKSKVSHVEFSLLDPNLFVTASIDHTVKLWDLRMISDDETKYNPTYIFPHQKGVNSAYFSPSNRHSLLTTDQHSEIRVYKSPMWDQELIIKHPHRHFQHLTPIQATWHPIEDIFVVGRYPDDNYKGKDERTIDVFDARAGDLLHKFNSPTGGIVSLNVFNATGDCMVSGSGGNLIFMNDKRVFDASYKFTVFQPTVTEMSMDS